MSKLEAMLKYVSEHNNFYKATPRKVKGEKKWYNKDIDKQMSMSFLHDELKEVRTHKKGFLEQIERFMPWGDLHF